VRSLPEEPEEFIEVEPEENAEEEESIVYEGVVIAKKQKIKAEEFPKWLKALADFNLRYDFASVVVVIDPEEKVRDMLKPTSIMGFVEKFGKALKKRTKLGYIAVDCTNAPQRPRGEWREFVPLLEVMRVALAVAVLYFKEPKPGWFVNEGDIVVEID
jgi:hypothetical protein